MGCTCDVGAACVVAVQQAVGVALYFVSFFFPTDRLVMLGNHRDAWIFGAVDPSSGTAALMETARVLGQLKDKGQCCGRLIGWLPWATHAPSI